MVKWEYHIVVLNTGGLEGIVAELNALGVEGWELVSVEGAFHTLKRPLG